MERAHEVCLEMLEQRDYSIIEDEPDRIIALKPDNKQMIVFFSESPKFNVKNIQVYISVMNELEIFHSIIIYKDGVTSFTKKTIDQSLEMYFELFSVEDLQYNITKHVLQPKFERLPEKEAANFKKQFGLKFGIMKSDDPIALFYDYKKGDVIRITRNSSKTPYITYRIVKG
jgi:DNA-directed RNA polymerase I, II, and III subunit RPABC1